MNYAEFENLSEKVEVRLAIMKSFVRQEDYDDFLETFGDIYTDLRNAFTEAVVNNETEDVDKLYELLYDTLIPDAVDAMKESWKM